MRHTHTHKVIKMRRIVRGQGIKDEIIEFGRHGVRYLKNHTINGVRQLVPHAVRGMSGLARGGIDKLSHMLHLNHGMSQAANNAADSLMIGVGDLIDDKLRKKLGGAVRPGRHLLLKEINHALSGSRSRR